MVKKLNQFRTIQLLNELGIKYKGNPNSKGYLSIICPLHPDKDFGNAGIDINTGIINCFRCNGTAHIVNLIKDKLGVSYKEAEKHVYGEGFNPSINSNLDERLNDKIVNKKEKLSIKKSTGFNFTYIDLKPEKYLYTRLRDFTQEFINDFNVVHCVSGFYDNYIIIPIKDSSKGIDTFEARKLMEYEEGLKFFELDNAVGFKRLRTTIKLYIGKNSINIKKGKLYFNGLAIEDDRLKYLTKPKVLYPYNSQVDNTIFNYDNLDRNKDLYICEGIGTIPKIYSYLSKNVTSVFGVRMKEKQLECLKEFKKKKIIIPDISEAETILIWGLVSKIPDVWVADIKIEDTEASFINNLKSAKIIEGSRYLIRKSGILKKG